MLSSKETTRFILVEGLLVRDSDDDGVGVILNLEKVRPAEGEDVA